ncbi:MAG TPA: hypothetical protein VD886_17510 [Herpetosiphonaceae bacterium]|nr:hypothetical protein [Herpetosiphonaceae bacterium]
MKIISTFVHGVLDYLTALAGLALPHVLGWNDDAKVLLNAAAGAVVLSSLVTRYELSVIKRLPMKAHLALDALNGALLIAAPLLWLRENSAVTTFIIGMGVMELAVVLLTKTQSPLEANRDLPLANSR